MGEDDCYRSGECDGAVCGCQQQANQKQTKNTKKAKAVALIPM